MFLIVDLNQNNQYRLECLMLALNNFNPLIFFPKYILIWNILYIWTTYA